MPEDIRVRIERKSKQTGWPQNRVIINELAAFPELEKGGRDLLSGNLQHMNNLLARYGARIKWLDLSEALLKSVDAVLKAEGSAALQAAVDKLRIDRAAMLKTKTTGADQ